MNYKVVKTNSGYAVQNTKTYTVVNVYSDIKQAEKVVQNLNKKG